MTQKRHQIRAIKLNLLLFNFFEYTFHFKIIFELKNSSILIYFLFALRMFESRIKVKNLALIKTMSINLFYQKDKEMQNKRLT
jgi:hypothetical protein